MASKVDLPWAIITGASEGIGVGFAECLDKRQTHNIVLVARTKAKLEGVAKNIKNVKTRILVADLSAVGAAEDIIKQTKDLKVSLLINNAGMAPGGNHDEIAFSTVQKTIALNMTTPAELMSLMIPTLNKVRVSLKDEQKKSKYGLSGIINVGSMSAFFPIPSMALYAATKAFLLSLSESLYQEQRNIGSDLPIICTLPGPVKSEIWTKEGASSKGVLIPMDTIEHVVSATMSAFDSNRALIIPGYMNNFVALTARLSPRRINRFVSRISMGQDPALRDPKEVEETFAKHGITRKGKA